MNFSERRKNVADSRYSMLSYECDLLKRQVGSGGGCSGEMVQRLANASNNVDAFKDDFNRRAVHVQNSV